MTYPDRGKMNSIRTDRKPSSIWPIVAFTVVVGLAPPMIVQMTDYWQSTLPARWGPLVNMFLLSIFVGQWMFVVLISGLAGRVWLKGLAMGWLLVVFWIAIIAMIEPKILNFVFNFFFDFRLPFIEAPEFLFATPGALLGSAVPLLVCRLVLGWRLTWSPTAYAPRGKFGIEELLLFTTALASILSLFWISNSPFENRAAFLHGIFFSYMGLAAAGSLFVLIPAVYIAFRIETRRHRWMAYIGIVGLAYLFLSLANQFDVNTVVLYRTWYMIPGFALILSTGLKTLRLTGLELLRFESKETIGVAQECERRWSDRKARRVWTFGFLLFSALSIFLHTAIDGWNNLTNINNVKLLRSMQQQGGSIDVKGRNVVDLKFGPDTTDQTLRDWPGMDSVTTISLANTQVTDAGLKFLMKFPSLISLDLNRTTITNSGLDDLQKLKLTHLNLAYTQVTLAELSKAKELLAHCKSFDLSGLGIDDQECPLLLPFLGFDRSLYARDNQLTDNALKELFGQSDLCCGTLDFSGNPINGSCFRELANVKTLILESIPVTDSVLNDVFAPNGSLKAPMHETVVSNTQLTEAALGCLGARVELGEGISESSLADCTVAALTELKLKGKSFDGRCFDKWHPTIQKLDMSGSAVSDETIPFLSNFTWLISLNLENTAISDASLPYLRSVANLKIANTRITFEGLRDASLPNAWSVHIALGQFSVDQVRELKKKHPIIVGQFDLFQF